jgi:hypothetical protein
LYQPLEVLTLETAELAEKRQNMLFKKINIDNSIQIFNDHNSRSGTIITTMML